MASPVKRYQLQNRYQDSGWELLNEEFDSVGDAVITASRYSMKPIVYGMVRVVDVKLREIVVTFPAGLEPSESEK